MLFRSTALYIALALQAQAYFVPDCDHNNVTLTTVTTSTKTIDQTVTLSATGEPLASVTGAPLDKRGFPFMKKHDSKDDDDCDGKDKEPSKKEKVMAKVKSKMNKKHGGKSKGGKKDDDDCDDNEKRGLPFMNKGDSKDDDDCDDKDEEPSKKQVIKEKLKSKIEAKKGGKQDDDDCDGKDEEPSKKEKVMTTVESRRVVRRMTMTATTMRREGFLS